MSNEFDHAGFAKAQEAATRYNVTSQPPKPEEEPKNDFDKAQRLATQHDPANAWKSETTKPQQVAAAPENKPEDKKPVIPTRKPVQTEAAPENEPADKKPVIPAQKPVQAEAAPEVQPKGSSSVWLKIPPPDMNSPAIVGSGNELAPKSADSRTVQQALSDAGYKVKVDGIIGPETRLALEQFAKNTDRDPKAMTLGDVNIHIKAAIAYQADGEQKLAQKTTTPAAPTADALTQQRQPASENTDLAWDPKKAEIYYNPKKLDDLNGATTASFGEAAAKPPGSQPTHSLVQDMSMLNIFKPATPT